MRETLELPGRSGFRNRPETRIRPGRRSIGYVRAPITAAVVACLAAAGVSGCTQPTQTYVIADYGGADRSGYQTPQQALQSLLAQHERALSETGWKLTGRTADAATFVSGNDSVDVVRNKAGPWNVGGVTACT